MLFVVSCSKLNFYSTSSIPWDAQFLAIYLAKEHPAFEGTLPKPQHLSMALLDKYPFISNLLHYALMFVGSWMQQGALSQLLMAS
jgi:hypothetical protein